MTFAQWWATLETREQQRADKEFTREAFAAGVASQDAEVAQQSDNYARALVLVNQRDRDIHYLKEECDQLRAQVNAMLDILEKIQYVEPSFVASALKKLIDNTPEQSLAEYRNKVIEEHESQIADELEAWRARFDDDYEFRPGMGVVTMKKQP